MVGEVAGSVLLAGVVTKLVDLFRKFDKDDDAPKALWILISMGIGILLAIAFQINVLAELGFDQSDWRQGFLGQVLTGALVGGFCSGWHEVFDAASSMAKLSRARAATQPLSRDGKKVVWGVKNPEQLRDDEMIVLEALARAGVVLDGDMPDDVREALERAGLQPVVARRAEARRAAQADAEAERLAAEARRASAAGAGGQQEQ